MSALFYTQIDDSPVGPLLLAGDSEALHVLAFGVGSRPREIDADWNPDTKGVLKAVRKELDQYFAGTLRKFSTRLAFNGTPFQNEVWKELTRIPYGETISYLDLQPDQTLDVRASDGHGANRSRSSCTAIASSARTGRSQDSAAPTPKRARMDEKGQRTLLKVTRVGRLEAETGVTRLVRPRHAERPRRGFFAQQQRGSRHTDMGEFGRSPCPSHQSVFRHGVASGDPLPIRRL